MDLYRKNLQKNLPCIYTKKVLEGFETLSPSSNYYIFKAFCYRKKKNGHTKKKPLSYSQTRKIVLEAFEKIGLPRNKFGLHSLRSGGATSAANIGVKDRLFKKQGCWKSEKAKDGYIKHSIRELVHVSANPGI